jgi:DNA-dependent RNA polymerase auxiliary subunit epsilon
MSHWIVTEKQVRTVAYYVEADSEEQARDLVNSMGIDDYDELVDCAETEIILVESN